MQNGARKLKWWSVLEDDGTGSGKINSQEAKRERERQRKRKRERICSLLSFFALSIMDPEKIHPALHKN